MSRGKSRSEGRREPRAWLGPPSQGGERLARAFDIGSPAKPDVARMLSDLRTSLMRLEEEVDELGWIVEHTISRPTRSEHGRPPPVELPHVPQTTDRDYWLSRCDYFTVYAGKRVVGTVEGMRFRSRVDRPDLLEVRCGHLGRRLLLVPVDDVELVKPEERLIVLLGPGPTPNGADATTSVPGLDGQMVEVNATATHVAARLNRGVRHRLTKLRLRIADGLAVDLGDEP